MTPTRQPGANLTWLLDTVWGQPGSGWTLEEPSAGSPASFVVVPNLRRARALLPDTKRGARAALLAGGSTRGARARRRRAVAAALFGSGVDRLVFRDRIWIVGEDPLRTAIQEALGGQPVTLAATVRPPGPFRKPVVSVVTPHGQVIAYAKVAWNAVTGSNVAAEYAALKGLAALGDDAVSAPRPAALLEHKGFPVVLTHAMPPSLRRYAAPAPPEATVSRVVARVLGTSATGTDPVGERLRGRLTAMRAAAALPMVAEAASDLVEALGSRTEALPSGAWHGDWSAWNLGWEGERLWAWDWEYCRPDAPIGMDIPHFTFQQRFIVDRSPLPDAFGAARIAAAAPLSVLGYDADARAAVHAVHAADIALRYLEAEVLGVAANPRFVTGAGAALRAATEDLD
jgi:hypothetical protein